MNSLEQSSEELNQMERSTKKQKGGVSSFSPQRPLRSYRDSIIQPECNWGNHSTDDLPPSMVDEDSDIESDSEDQCPVIQLSKDDKRRIQAPWQSALIIKAFGKSVGFKYMDFKIHSLWATQRWHAMYWLGFGFFSCPFQTHGRLLESFDLWMRALGLFANNSSLYVFRLI